LDAVKDTAEDAKPSVRDAFNAAKDTTEDAKQSVVGTLDAVKDTAEDLKPSDNPDDNQAKERVVIDNSLVNTGEVGMGEPTGTQIEVISDPVEIGRIVEQTKDVNPETSLVPIEADFREGRNAGMESFGRTGEI
jgi:stress response protein YsnF